MNELLSSNGQEKKNKNHEKICKRINSIFIRPIFTMKDDDDNLRQ